MKNYKKIMYCFSVVFVLGQSLFAQTRADSISIVFPKVLFTNEKKQVLLYYDNRRNAYEVPSMGTLDGPVSFKSYIDSTAKDMGIMYESFRLGGIFTYLFPNEYSTYIRPYFVVKFKKYATIDGLTDPAYKWFSYKDAIKQIPYPASAMIVEKLLNHPRTVWGASFEEFGYTNPVDRSKIKFKILEGFYKIN
jgi:hypothetical protein